MDKEKNPYENVPGQGREFQEGGGTFYWSFSQAAIGETIDEWQYGVTLGADIDATSCHATQHGVRVHVTAVEQGRFDGKTAIKWQCLDGEGSKRTLSTVLQSGHLFLS